VSCGGLLSVAATPARLEEEENGDEELELWDAVCGIEDAEVPGGLAEAPVEETEVCYNEYG
jgi:hypothetical protein